MNIQTLAWKNSAIRIIDQTQLPEKLIYLNIRDLRHLWQAIKVLKVRGAPALGAAAALGVYLGVKNSRAKSFTQFYQELKKVVAYLGSARPTAINLFWGLRRMQDASRRHRNLPIIKLKQALLKEALRIISEDRTSCRAIGRHGAKLIKNNFTILTVCNAGILATIDYGTALGVIYKAKAQGKHVKVYACETRPLLQGSRLTAWELHKKGIAVTLICDNMAATLMRQGKIDCVIAGADRIAANGDAANKIGTYSLAVSSKFHKIPFYIAAPASSFDLTLPCGRQIPIEERDSREVTQLFFKQAIAPQGIKVFNPAFDVTPHNLITAIITDRGVIRRPYQKNIRRVLKNVA